MPLRSMQPPTKRSRVRFVVRSANRGPSGRNRSTSTPYGTTWTRSAGTPLATAQSRPHVVGTHSSSTTSRTGPTHSAGSSPNSHGCIRTRRPLAGGERLGGH